MCFEFAINGNSKVYMFGFQFSIVWPGRGSSWAQREGRGWR